MARAPADILIIRSQHGLKNGKKKKKMPNSLQFLQRENVSLLVALVHACMFGQLVVSSSSVTPWTVACQSPLSTEFPRQKQWSGLPFSTPGDLPNLRIKPATPALAGGFFTTGPLWIEAPQFSSVQSLSRVRLFATP